MALRLPLAVYRRRTAATYVGMSQHHRPRFLSPDLEFGLCPACHRLIQRQSIRRGRGIGNWRAGKCQRVDIGVLPEDAVDKSSDRFLRRFWVEEKGAILDKLHHGRSIDQADILRVGCMASYELLERRAFDE